LLRRFQSRKLGRQKEPWRVDVWALETLARSTKTRNCSKDRQSAVTAELGPNGLPLLSHATGTT
jgi:hypothetical protein